MYVKECRSYNYNYDLFTSPSFLMLLKNTLHKSNFTLKNPTQQTQTKTQIKHHTTEKVTMRLHTTIMGGKIPIIRKNAQVQSKFIST